MNLIIQISEELSAILEARARAKGVTPDRLANRVLQEALAGETEDVSRRRPLKTGYGSWAKFGPAPSEVEIEENRRDMLRNFGQDI